jgi:hypothetical protein
MEPKPHAESSGTESSPSPRESALPFARESAVYDAHLIDLLDSQGKYVLIYGEEITGPFETFDEALDVGYDKYGLELFMVKQIHKAEPIHYFSRDLAPCRR